MKRARLILIALAFVLVFPLAPANAQNWTGILKPTFGSGACTLAPNDQAAGCAIEWSQSGIPGGIPSGPWTQSGSTITATGSDQSSQIQTALNACGTNHYVLLASGTFTINTSVNVPSNCELRGSGANLTVLNVHGSSVAPVVLGNGSIAFSPRNITAGATAGSTSITLSSVTGINIGGYLVVTDVNEPWVTIHGGEGDCNWCDGGWTSNAQYARGQIVEVTNVVGSVIAISPGLYSDYSNSPIAVSFTMAAKNAGVKDLQIFMNNTGYTDGFYMEQCAYCWLVGNEVNYADGDFAQISWSYHDQIQSNYFSNAYAHGPGQTDADVFVNYKTSGTLVVNNIIERNHSAVLVNWGAAGNVIAYNYVEGGFSNDPSAQNFCCSGMGMHGAHPQFNLFEGNVTPGIVPDEVWGSSSHNTMFRNWVQGTTLACNPMLGRGTVVCSPIGQNQSPGINGWYPFQASRAYDITHYAWYYNLIGDIVGSVNQQNLLAYGGATSHIAILPWSGAVSRSYDFTNYNFTFGYGEAGDDGQSSDGCGGSTVSPCHSVDAYKTSFIYNAFTNANGATNCLSGGSSSTCSTSLPASFFLGGKPTWWPIAVSYPAIGPDIAGGTGPGGHASLTASNPAQYCYLVTMGGSEGGAGSPLAFNENTCYSGSSGGAPPPPPPAPPTNLSAVVQ